MSQDTPVPVREVARALVHKTSGPRKRLRERPDGRKEPAAGCVRPMPVRVLTGHGRGCAAEQFRQRARCQAGGTGARPNRIDAGRLRGTVDSTLPAGFDVAQIGPNQDDFFRFYETEVLPRLR